MQEQIHELWLIYNELKEMDTGDSVYLAQRLGKVINALNRVTPEGAVFAALGAKGGAVKSDAKREAARDNGAKGGRPRLCAGCGRKMTPDETRTNGLGDCCESKPDALDGVYDIHETKDDGGGFYAELTLKDKRGTQYSPTFKTRKEAEKWATENGGTKPMWNDL